MACKRAVSISLGSASRDFRYEVEAGDQRLILQRIGTDGNLKSCSYLLRHFDGNVHAIGLGGINLAYRSGSFTYLLPEAQWLASLARYTPVVDGAGAKRYWETGIPALLAREEGWEWKGQKVLILSALDRWELAETLLSLGAELRIADPLLALKLPLAFRNLSRFQLLARITLPFLSLLPIKTVYPQTTQTTRRPFQGIIDGLKDWASCIVGDHRFLACLTPRFRGQRIITSGVGSELAAYYLSRGADKVVSMNHIAGGGPLPANLWEAALVAASDRSLKDLSLPSLTSHTHQLGLGAAVWRLEEGRVVMSLLSCTG